MGSKYGKVGVLTGEAHTIPHGPTRNTFTALYEEGFLQSSREKGGAYSMHGKDDDFVYCVLMGNPEVKRLL